MRKLFSILAIAAVAITSQVSAQNNDSELSNSPNPMGKFYVGVHGGYNLGMGKTVEGTNQTDNADGSINYEAQHYSFGKGGNFGLDFGFMFTRNMGAELSVDYLVGANNETTYNSYTGINAKTVESGKMLMLQPKLVLRANAKKVTPYAKLGVTFGLMPEVMSEVTLNAPGSNLYTVEKYDGSGAIGVNGAIGADFSINPNMSFFAEVRGMSLTYRPKKSEITEANLNGVSVLSSLTVSNRETEYVDEYTDPAVSNPNVPSKSTKVAMPFSNIGLNVGFKYMF